MKIWSYFWSCKWQIKCGRGGKRLSGAAKAADGTRPVAETRTHVMERKETIVGVDSPRWDWRGHKRQLEVVKGYFVSANASVIVGH